MTTVSFCLLGRIYRWTWSEKHWLAAGRGLGASLQGAAVCGFVHLQLCYRNSPLSFCCWLERVIVAKVITESSWVRMGAGSKPSNRVLVLRDEPWGPAESVLSYQTAAGIPTSSMWNPAQAMELRGVMALRTQGAPCFFCCSICYWHCSGI